MTDYRTMYDKDFVYAYDLDGKDVTVTIERVEARELTGTSGKKSRKPTVFFVGSLKGLMLNATNGKTIAAMYTPKVENWIGKKITIYPTTTEMAGQTVDCIRVRPTIPADEKGKK